MSRADGGSTGAVKLAAKGALAALVILAAAFAADWALRTENLPVRYVRFEGPFKRVQQAELERAVLPLARGNFLLVDLDEVQRRVEALAWVHRASVRRAFPNDLHVYFTEQRIVAQWGTGAWLNGVGEVVELPTGERMPAGLPRLEGPDGSGPAVLARYRAFGGILGSAGLEIKRLTLAPRQSFRLELVRADSEAAMVMVLDPEEAEKKLQRFARVYAAALPRDAGEIRHVDLRYANGFAIEWAPGRPALGHVDDVETGRRAGIVTVSGEG